MDKIKVMIVGCGDRATVYAKEGYKNLKSMEIVAAVDPDDVRLKYMQDEFNVPKEMCFKTVEEVLAKGCFMEPLKSPQDSRCTYTAHRAPREERKDKVLAVQAAWYELSEF